jgi:hypothetical protein
LNDISPIRLRALELAVQAGAYQNASQFLRFLQGGPGADEAFSQPAPVASFTKTAASKAKASTQPSSPTPSEITPAQAPAEKPATAPEQTASATSVALVLEEFQKKCSDAVLALAKLDRNGAVAILEQYKVQRFGQMKPADYPEFYTKVEAALAAVAAKKAAEASDPASLV